MQGPKLQTHLYTDGRRHQELGELGVHCLAQGQIDKVSGRAGDRTGLLDNLLYLSLESQQPLCAVMVIKVSH